MKKLVIGIGIALGLLVLAALILPSFINWNRYRTEIAGAAEDLTGREVSIGGSIAFSVLPAPALLVKDVRVANLPGAATVDMLKLKSLEVRVALLPLLRGQFQVQKVVLVEPVIEFERLADGQRNWVLGEEGEAGPAEGPPPSADIQLENFVVRGGQLTYRDAASGAEYTLDDLDVTVSANSLDGPFAATGRLGYQGLPVAFEISTGVRVPRRPMALAVTLRLGDGAGEAKFSGSATIGEPGLDGRLEVSGRELAKLLAAVSGSEGGKAALPGFEPLLGLPFVAKANIEVDGKGARIADLSLELGSGENAISGTGRLGVDWQEQTSIDLKLAIASINLDALGVTGDPPAASRENRPAETSAPQPDDPFSLPADIGASFDVSVAAVTLHEGLIRNLRLAGKLASGTLEITWASAQLPGTSDISFAGTLRAVDEGPRLEGKVKAASNNLRGLLRWLQADIAKVPPGRLTKATVSGSLAATRAAVQLYAMDMTVDTSRITGGVAFALRKRTSFSADLDIDRLNLDAYLPPRRPTEKPRGAPTRAAVEEAPAKVSALAALDKFDTNFKLRVERLTYKQTLLTGLEADLSLIGGELDIKTLAVKDVGGAGLTLSGKGQHFSGRPRLVADLKIAGKSLAGFEKIVGVKLPWTTPAAGNVTITAKLDGDFEQKVAVDTDIALGPTRARATGRITGLDRTPVFNLTLDIGNDSLAAFIRQFDIDMNPPAKRDDGAVTLKGTVNGPLSSLDVNVALDVAGGRFSVAGNVARRTTGVSYDVSLGVRSDSLIRLVRGLGHDFRPASKRLGGIDVSADVKGDAGSIVLSALTGNIGPVSLNGEANLKFTQGRPKLTARLQAGEVVADMFLAPERASARRVRKTRAAPGVARWSREPFDLGWLRKLDADVELSARRIAFRAYEFVVPEATLRLGDGTLEISRLKGRLFDGDIDLTARLQGSVPARVWLDFKLRGAAVDRALKATADIAAATGRFDMDGSFKAAGASQFEMISALTGKATLAARDGVIRGIDLRRVSDGLNKIEKIEDYFALIRAGLSGGVTPYKRIAGDLVIKNGVARTRNVVAEIEAASADLSAVIDLPDWRIDATSRFRFIDHPDAPSVGLDLSGPLHDPKRKFVSREMQAYIGRKLGAAVLRRAIAKPGSGLDRLLGGTPADAAPAGAGEPASAAPQGTAPAPTTTTPEPTAETPPPDPAQQLLEGILNQIKKKKGD